MTAHPTARTPYDHTLWLINGIESTINTMVSAGPVNGPTASSIIGARSGLAIASALLAVSDAIRSHGNPAAETPPQKNGTVDA